MLDILTTASFHGNHHQLKQWIVHINREENGKAGTILGRRVRNRIYVSAKLLKGQRKAAELFILHAENKVFLVILSICLLVGQHVTENGTPNRKFPTT